MDPLTHALLGGSIGYTAGSRTLGRGAAVVGMAGGTFADLDVFIRSSTDPLLAVEYHRHFTHAFAFAPLGAALAVSPWLFAAWIRRQRGASVRSHRHERPLPRGREWLRALWTTSFLAYLSHILLDAATSYGTQLLWPLSDRRFGWDFVSVIDPLVTLVLAVGLLVALLTRAKKAAAVGALLATLYIAVGAAQHGRAVAAQAQVAAARGHVIERSEVMPTLGNTLVWRALYEHGGRIHADRIRVGWFSGSTVRPGWSLPKIDQADLTPAERARSAANAGFERFAWFSEGWVARSPGDPSVLGDMRYSLSTEAFDPVWGIRFTPAGAPSTLEWVSRSNQRRVDPAELWREIVGQDPRFRRVQP